MSTPQLCEVVVAIEGVGFEVVKHEEVKYHPVRAPQVGICKAEEIQPEPLFVGAC